jgi:hypothetical protein
MSDMLFHSTNEQRCPIIQTVSRPRNSQLLVGWSLLIGWFTQMRSSEPISWFMANFMNQLSAGWGVWSHIECLVMVFSIHMVPVLVRDCLRDLMEARVCGGLGGLIDWFDWLIDSFRLFTVTVWAVPREWPYLQNNSLPLLRMRVIHPCYCLLSRWLFSHLLIGQPACFFEKPDGGLVSEVDWLIDWFIQAIHGDRMSRP